MVAGADLRLDGINSSRLAATALYTTSPSVAYLRISLRIHHNGQSTEHFAPTPCGCVGWVMSPSRQCSFLLCRNEKAQGVNLGLEFFGFGTTERIPSVRDESIQFFREMQYLFPIYFQY